MLFDDIKNANIQALKDHNKQAREILSLLFGKLKNESIDKGLHGTELPDGDVLRIISKTIKELEEEAESFKKASREEKVNELLAQRDLLKEYLPQMMSEDEIRKEIEKLEDKKIPNVMKHFKANFNGLCDMGLVSKIAKEYQ